MRKVCGFTVPKPLVVTSNKGRAKHNHKVRHIIYPDLGRFKKACGNCRYRDTEDKRSRCLLGDKDFNLKYYGFQETASNGVVLTLGAVPTGLKYHSLRVAVDAYLHKHSQSSDNGGQRG